MDTLKTQVSPFLKLPAEIRNEIYRYLLCTKYTKHLSESQVRIKVPFEEMIKSNILSQTTAIPDPYVLAQLHLSIPYIHSSHQPEDPT